MASPSLGSSLLLVPMIPQPSSTMARRSVGVPSAVAGPQIMILLPTLARTLPPSDPSANLAFDPAAWLMCATEEPRTVFWDLFGAHVIGALIGMLVTLFCFAAPSIWQVLHWMAITFGWSLLAPVCWIAALLLTIARPWLIPPWPDSSSPNKSSTKHPKTRRLSPTIRNMNFHKRYPRQLRSQGHYFVKAPSVARQEVFHQASRIQAAAARILDVVMRSHATKSTGPKRAQEGAGQGQGRYNYYVPRTKPSRPPVDLTSAHCSSSKPKRRRPTPRRCAGMPHAVPTSHHHSFGNNSFTTKQKAALAKIVNQCMMVSAVSNTLQPLNPAIFRAALQSPRRLQAALPKEATYPIIWDSGASISISPSREDFVGPYNPPSVSLRLQGISKGLHVAGQGHVMWAVHDSAGMLRILKVPAYHVPGAKVRLLSTTSLLQSYPGETITVESSKMTLSGLPGDPTKGTVSALINPVNNLPTSTAYRYDATIAAPASLNATISEVHQQNHNLSEPEKELLRWHQRLGHMSMKRVQFLMRTGVLAHTQATRRLHTAACQLNSHPRCAACQFGKQTRRPTPGKTVTAVRDRAGVLKAGDLVPGQKVSVDHFVCSTKGRLLSSRGKTADHEMYSGGALFVDHASNYVDVRFQKHLNSHETIVSKDEFELMCRDVGVIPQEYLSDNGSCFASAAYTDHLRRFQQTTRFAGVGAHHHNGNAERAIQTIMSIARTMMLHAAIHWPDVSDPCLWPMAVSHAVFLHNHVPDSVTGLAPSDVFTKTRWPQSKLHDLNVWGCPVYVLDKAMQDGRKLPRWKPRSTRMVNMGLSPQHATSVPLLLNPESGAITAQFHVVFDNWFSTIATKVDDLPDFHSDEWSRMFGDSTFVFPYDDEDLQRMIDEADAPSPRQATQRAQVDDAFDTHAPPAPLAIPPTPTSSPPSATPNPHTPESSPMLDPRETGTTEPEDDPLYADMPPLERRSSPREPSPVPVPNPSTPARPQRESPAQRRLSYSRERQSQSPEASVPSPAPTIPSPAPSTPSAAMPPRRSTRNNLGQHSTRLGYDGTSRGGYVASADNATSSINVWHLELPPPTHFTAYYSIFGANSPLPFCFKASSSDPDTLSFDEAMSDPDFPKWRLSADSEIRALESKKTWLEESIEKATSKILPGTWVFRRKRSPDGTVKKYKARYCVRGDLQEGDFDTFAPVVAWSTVRLFLVMALTLGWHTCSIDFSNAFVQATLTEPVWIHLPRGFRSSSPGGRTCLRLLKSLYGLSVAPKLWYEHLFTALKALGFTQSSIDPCLLYKSGIMLVCYVDDAGIAAASEELVDKLIADLVARGFELTREGSFTEFLGIKFTQDPVTKAIVLTQKGLIQKILQATDMVDCNPNWLPAAQVGLGSDPDGVPMRESWGYASIVGMLLYLSTNTRPDISFAVSQVARFNHSPKQSHATAVKMIVRYLARTADKGMTLHPTGKLNLDCYVDADFAGLHRSEPDESPNSVRSRTGYLVKLGNCPLIWKSQLQTKIALSTVEAEYSALSQCMRSLLPLNALLKEVAIAVRLPANAIATIKCTVFEDNNGALLLATNQKISNRTKHFLVEWHFFWEHVQEGVVQVVKIDTKDQQADFLTKGLSRELFETNRKSVQGW